MNVLSLFDGMSCGQIALRELGFKVDNYFASEIDKHAIAQTQLNFPDTVQLGSVTDVHATDLPHIDLLIGGSPCQGFSFAGKQLNFNDPRSVLFFEYVRILREIQEYNPGVLFLLENVRMRRECEQAITEQLGLEPVVINSALVSAQNRVRLYWTNIRTREEANLFGTKVFTNIPQPDDRGIYLRDILEDHVDSRYYISQCRLAKLLEHQSRQKELGNGFGFYPPNEDQKAKTVRVGGRCQDDIVRLSSVRAARCVALRGRFNHGTGKNEQQTEFRYDGKTNCLTSVEKDNFIYQFARGYNVGGKYPEKVPTLTSSSWEHNNILASREVIQLNPDDESGGKQPYQQNRVYSVDGISPALCSAHAGAAPAVLIPDMILRRLTPTECARLQTIPEWYKWACSESQTYRMLGNGWTVEVIKHIFSFLNIQ